MDWSPFTEKARILFSFAQDRARQLQHPYVGTEHLMMAIIDNESDWSSPVLEKLGVNVRILRQELEQSGGGEQVVIEKGMGPSAEATRVIDLAFEEARELGHPFVGSEHLFLAMVRCDEGNATRNLKKWGLTYSMARDRILDRVGTQLEQSLEHELQNIAFRHFKPKLDIPMPRVGLGVDVHPFIAGRQLILGGIVIAHQRGLAGHSDADVLIHAIMDAILGALGLGDIGRHFPDTDELYRGIASHRLLSEVVDFMSDRHYRLHNLDAVVMAEEPKLQPYFPRMKERLAQILKAEPAQINLKATTTEGLGFTGRKEGILAQAVVMLVPS